MDQLSPLVSCGRFRRPARHSGAFTPASNFDHAAVQLALGLGAFPATPITLDSVTLIATKWVVFLLILALAARIGAALMIGSGLHFVDEALYVDTASRLSSGGGFGVEYSQVPGYPVFLAILSLGLPVSTGSLRVAQAVLAGFGVVLVLALATRAFGHRAAIAAGLVYALDPLLVIASGLLYPETVAALLLPLVILTSLGGSKRDQIGRSAAAGSLLGILALLRPVALVLAPIVAVWIAATVSARPVRRMAHIGVLTIVFMLVLAPWAIRNSVVRGQLTPVPASSTHNAPVNPDAVGRQGLFLAVVRWGWNNPGALLERVTWQFAQFWELAPTRLATDNAANRQRFHRKDPRLEVQPLFSRQLRDFVSAGSFSVELCLALVGLVIAARTHWREAVLLFAVILAFATGYALFVAKVRYRIPILPLLFLFTGVGATAVLSWARRAVDTGFSSSAKGES